MQIKIAVCCAASPRFMQVVPTGRKNHEKSCSFLIREWADSSSSSVFQSSTFAHNSQFPAHFACHFRLQCSIMAGYANNTVFGLTSHGALSAQPGVPSQTGLTNQAGLPNQTVVLPPGHNALVGGLHTNLPAAQQAPLNLQIMSQPSSQPSSMVVQPFPGNGSGHAMGQGQNQGIKRPRSENVEPWQRDFTRLESRLTAVENE